MFPQEHICTATDNKMYCFEILGDKNDNTIYNDLTGRFPIRSYTGNNRGLCLRFTPELGTESDSE